MYYYRHLNRTLASMDKYSQLKEISEAEASTCSQQLFILTQSPAGYCRRSFCVSQPDLLQFKAESPLLLSLPQNDGGELPLWLLNVIKSGMVTMINTGYPSWEDVLIYKAPEKWRITIAGLGDVGGTLVSGLRLLGGDCISSIGIYDIDINKVRRWEFEANQILDPTGTLMHPPVVPLSKEQLFDCDMFIFCVTTGVPPLVENPGDVRLAQFEGNSRIIKEYAVSARELRYKGIFSVVSDPVDLLCKSAFIHSNTGSDGRPDYLGLAPEQIRGYGLGVMHARAAYFAGLSPDTSHYLSEGRAFGPHGEGLVIADSIENYNDMLSEGLTEKARTANLSVRSLGFKPYVAPALSSGSLSILATIRGQWHYSANFLGGVYFGARNRLLPSGIELERQPLPERLLS
ncbi:MAG: lactate/malate family dehydrogenase, partial [Pseudomonadota bacterium]